MHFSFLSTYISTVISTNIGANSFCNVYRLSTRVWAGAIDWFFGVNVLWPTINCCPLDGVKISKGFVSSSFIWVDQSFSEAEFPLLNEKQWLIRKGINSGEWLWMSCDISFEFAGSCCLNLCARSANVSVSLSLSVASYRTTKVGIDSRQVFQRRKDDRKRNFFAYSVKIRNYLGCVQIISKQIDSALIFFLANIQLFLSLSLSLSLIKRRALVKLFKNLTCQHSANHFNDWVNLVKTLVNGLGFHSSFRLTQHRLRSQAWRHSRMNVRNLSSTFHLMFTNNRVSICPLCSGLGDRCVRIHCQSSGQTVARVWSSSSRNSSRHTKRKKSRVLAQSGSRQFRPSWTGQGRSFGSRRLEEVSQPCLYFDLSWNNFPVFVCPVRSPTASMCCTWPVHFR